VGHLFTDHSQGVGTLFYMHLCFVFTLLAWSPSGKLNAHGGGLLSPDRETSPNDNPDESPSQPLERPVKVHTYEEYEE